MNTSNDHRSAARPDVMPVDREAWFDAVNLSMFVNTYYQLRDVRRWAGSDKSILIIGPGQGLDAAVFHWKGYRPTTFDIDDTFKPDIVGSCDNMGMFADQQFDVAIVSHVLEHLPPAYLDAALTEISRVAHLVLVYLPVAGRHPSLCVRPSVRNISLSVFADVFNPLRKPDPHRPVFCEGQHYWELGYRGFTKREVRQRMRKCFHVLDEYRNHDWLPSYNFVLRSLRKPA